MSPVISRKLKAYKASRFVLKVIAEYYPHLPKGELNLIVSRLAPARHADDFRSVRWYGKDYTFSALQAAIVEVLWNHWEKGTPKVGASILLSSARIDSDRVSNLFKGHPAWGVMIQSDNGHYWLVEFSDSTP